MADLIKHLKNYRSYNVGKWGDVGEVEGEVSLNSKSLENRNSNYNYGKERRKEEEGSRRGNARQSEWRKALGGFSIA